MQQGRVLLDSDWNEQGAIFAYYLQSLARDLIGRYGGPATNCGFKVIVSTPDPELADFPQDAFDHNFVIGRGHYYVDGLLCESDSFVTYAESNAPELEGVYQRDYFAEELDNGNYLIYLDVWERHVTALDDEIIREVALGPQGPDTTTRARVVWQVKALKLEGNAFNNFECANTLPQPPSTPIHPGWAAQLEKWQPANRGRLKAKADEADDLTNTNPCIISPEARYRGAENQLYRVEIHCGGTASTPATFKWQRDNASVVLPIRSVNGRKLTLEHLGRDARLSVEVGDWVEIEDYYFERKELAHPAPLLQVEEVRYEDLTVTVNADVPGAHLGRRVMRLWSQKAGDPRLGGLELRDGAAIIKEDAPDSNQNWLNLEDGIKIQFVRPSAGPPVTYRAGDYWLIPARTATGDVEWPGAVGNPVSVRPHGVEHHYAPLARISVGPAGVTVVADLRRKFTSLGLCPP
jgi:hypothetical protein